MTHPTKNGNVAISAGSLAPGGVETHARFLCLALRRNNVSVALYGNGNRWSDSTTTELRAAGVRFCGVPSASGSPSRFRSLFSLAQWILRPPRNASSLYWIGTGRSHFALQRLAGKNCTSIYHEIVTPDPNSPLIVESIRRADACIANSKRIVAGIASIRPDCPMATIPFLTSGRALSPPEPRSAIGDRPIHVGYLGRLEARKRPHVLVKEWRTLISSPGVGPAILHLHGQDEGNGMIKQLKAETNRAGLSQLIHFHGGYEVSDLPEIFSNLDLTVLPSEWEGLPLVLLESMQQGVPFVATAAGGTAEFGEGNPDVCVTGMDWDDFANGFTAFAARLRANQISATRLHQWAESRYGFNAVWPTWRSALTEPKKHFNELRK